MESPPAATQHSGPTSRLNRLSSFSQGPPQPPGLYLTEGSNGSKGSEGLNGFGARESDVVGRTKEHKQKKGAAIWGVRASIYTYVHFCCSVTHRLSSPSPVAQDLDEEARRVANKVAPVPPSRSPPPDTGGTPTPQVEERASVGGFSMCSMCHVSFGKTLLGMGGGPLEGNLSSRNPLGSMLIGGRVNGTSIC